MKCFFLSVLFLFPGLVFNQTINLKSLKGIEIRNIGPAGMSGRVTAIDVVEQNPQHIYIGAASGGVWESQDGGISWRAIFDNEPIQSIGAIAINQRNPSQIWVGTGEGNPRNSANSGRGLYRSLNGGKTWTFMGLEKTRTIHRIIIHPQNPDIIFVGAVGSAWGPNEDRGVYKSSDAGKTWQKVLYIDKNTGCADLVMDPTNPNKLIAAMWDYGRQPWFFTSGGPGSGLYISHNGGQTWDKKTTEDGLPKGELGRMGLAIAPSKPNVVYALIEAKENGLYRSTNGGESWTLRAKENIGNRPFYYADIFVDPKNENRIFNLYSLVSMSEDGGKTFRVILPWTGAKSVHPDHHAFWIHPDDPSYIIEGNDGGLNISRDGGVSWRFVENLPLAQFYHINYDMEIPYNVYGGMQDNGSWVGPAYVWKNGGIRNSDFREVLFGDGFDVVPQKNDPRYLFAMYQGGNLFHVDSETGKNQLIKPYHPDGEPLRFNWNAAIAQNPFQDCGIYFGSQYLHKSIDCGQTWDIISPDLTTNDSSKQKQYKSGGLTIDDTRAENFTTIVSIAPSPVDDQLIWVGTDDGNLQLTRDGGTSWVNCADKLPGFPKGSWIPQIEVNASNAGEAFVVVNDYRRNNWKPMLYHTQDFGASWRNLIDPDQVEGHCLAVVQDNQVPELLFLGTDQGLYFSINKGASWQKWTEGYPSAPTQDLKIHPREGDLIIGSFGRAAWIMDDITPLREIAKSQTKILNRPFVVFPTPPAYLASYRSVDGTRFLADGAFTGENRPGGARISIWAAPPAAHKERKDPENKKGQKSRNQKDEPGEKKPAASKNGKKATFLVLDMAGDTIRKYKSKLDTGLVRLSWNLRMDGVRFPSYSLPKKEDNLPSGQRVQPGKYKLKVFYKEHIDSTVITVNPDPRIPFNRRLYAQKLAAIENFNQLVEEASAGMTQLVEAKIVTELVNKSIMNLPDTIQKQIKEQSKVMQDSIAGLQRLFSLPPKTKGIQRTPNGLTYSLYDAQGYISAVDGPLSESAEAAVKKAEKDARQVFDRINRFFETEWKSYQELIQESNYSLFKPYDVLELKR